MSIPCPSWWLLCQPFGVASSCIGSDRLSVSSSTDCLSLTVSVFPFSGFECIANWSACKQQVKFQAIFRFYKTTKRKTTYNWSSETQESLIT
ncbi:uncharacterized protein Dvir_GJ26893 [Drosophila virilis]|uniref:Secreted protein n=1 Tax=Drosophila virilis TaxID=7244 RepID=A0A0Q9WPJ7_DROVI|nr:uncharacterized protein Dvir_GJ26893 [Drosophila virilis]